MAGRIGIVNNKFIILFAQRKVELSDYLLQTLNNNHLLPLVDLIPVPREKHVGDVGAEVDL